MTTSTPRPDIAPVLTATAAADAPHGASGVHITTILNIALLQQEQPDAAPPARAAPVAGVAYGPLIVDGIVFPGPRFGS